jgi:hypothetical protein
MEVIVINSEAFELLKKEMFCLIKQAVAEVLNEKKNAENSDWITIKEAQKLLPYKSKTTWQKFRDSGDIKFSKSKNGRFILYSRKSIIEYLNKNKVGF